MSAHKPTESVRKLAVIAAARKLDARARVIAEREGIAVVEAYAKAVEEETDGRKRITE